MSRNLTVVIPYYNGEQFLSETLTSIEMQSLNLDSENLETMIVDDGSTPASAAQLQKIVSNFPNLKVSVVSVAQNGGAARARNIGLEKTQSEYLAFLDADDPLCGRFSLESRLNFLDEHPDYLGIGGYSVQISKASQVLYNKVASTAILLQAVANPDSVLKYYCTNILENSHNDAATLFFLSGSLFRTKDIKEITFDPKYEKEEDVEWFLRVLQSKKFKPELVPCYFRRIHDGQYHLVTPSSLFEEVKSLSRQILSGL